MDFSPVKEPLKNFKGKELTPDKEGLVNYIKFLSGYALIDNETKVREIKRVFEYCKDNQIQVWEGVSVNSLPSWISRIILTKSEKYRVQLLLEAGMPEDIKIPVRSFDSNIVGYVEVSKLAY